LGINHTTKGSKMASLFTRGTSNPKTNKSEGKGYETLILHLAPANVSGYNVCSSASAGCKAGCLNTAGRGKTSSVQNGRIRKTRLYFEHRDEFKRQILTELTAFVKRCQKNGTLPAVRMNGTSDIVWEKVFPEIFTLFPSIQFYDYTKHVKRCLSSWILPKNYHLTFSRSEDNDDAVAAVLADGKCNVAVVFMSRDFPQTFEGFPVYSADGDDLRFLDNDGEGGAIGALYAKGDAKRDASGFVLPNGETLIYA
jgi:hypothetical protein